MISGVNSSFSDAGFRSVDHIIMEECVCVLCECV